MMTLLLLVVFVMCVAFLFSGGLWTCALAFCNVLFAALLATSYFEPLAEWFARQLPGLTYCWDFVALWLIFAVAYLLLRAVTDFLSKVQVRFKRPLDVAGAVLFSSLTGWLVVCLVAMSLHASPLAADFLSAFPEPQQKLFFGFGPDRVWLAFAQKTSQGALDCSNTFDPRAEFIFKYRDRRVKYETKTSFIVGGKD